MMRTTGSQPLPPLAASDGSERRIFERRNIYLPLAYTARTEGREQIRGTGTTVNISAGGAFFLCREKRVEAGMRLEMVLSPESALVHDRKVVLNGTVLGVYRFAGADEHPTDHLGVAVKFEEEWNFDWPEEGSRAFGNP